MDYKIAVEVIALIREFGLVPRNYWASDFMQLLENEQLRKDRLNTDLRALHNRNFKRKQEDVFATSDYQLSLPFE